MIRIINNNNNNNNNNKNYFWVKIIGQKKCIPVVTFKLEPLLAPKEVPKREI